MGCLAFFFSSRVWAVTFFMLETSSEVDFDRDGWSRIESMRPPLFEWNPGCQEKYRNKNWIIGMRYLNVGERIKCDERMVGVGG